MAHELPSPEKYTGLSRKALQYCETFRSIVDGAKQPGFSEASWAPLEALLDVERFERVGVLRLSAGHAETIDWPQYRKYLSQYAATASWEATLRRISEVPGVVFLELVERNIRDGTMHAASTLIVYEFDEAGKLRHLDVYAQPHSAAPQPIRS